MDAEPKTDTGSMSIFISTSSSSFFTATGTATGTGTGTYAYRRDGLTLRLLLAGAAGRRPWADVWEVWWEA
jgi:hypothetical protein